MLQRTISQEHASAEAVKEKMTMLKSSISASDLLPTIMVESDKSLKASCAEVLSQKE